jgi:hypothetical protein
MKNLIEMSFVIGSLPVLNSEEQNMYWALYESIVKALKPDDPHEYLLMKTIADCDWQTIRYERAKSRIIDLKFKEALKNVLRPLMEKGTILISPEHDADGLSRDWYADEETKRTIKDHLCDYGLDELAVEAEAIRLAMKELAALEQLVQSNERRRSWAYRDLQMWREGKRFEQSARPKALPSM